MATDCTKLTLGSNWVIGLNPTVTKGEPTVFYREGNLTVTSPCSPIGEGNRYVVYISNEGFQFLGSCNYTIEYVDCNTTPGSYDCLNGQCIKNTSNKGYFKTLEDCQKLCAFSCGNGKQCVDPNVFCPPGKICLDSSEYTQITDLISRISQQVCG